MNGLIERDPVQRLTAAEALEHPWFKLHLQAAPAEEHAVGNIVPRGTHSIPTPAAAPALAAAKAAPASSGSMLRIGRSYPLAALQQRMPLAAAA